MAFIPEVKFSGPLVPMGEISILKDGSSLKARPRMNFITGPGMSIAVTDNASTYATNITVGPLAPGYYGSFYDTTTQFATSSSSSYSMTLNTTVGAQGVSIVSASQVKVSNAGTYNIQFSSQFSNSDSQAQRLNLYLAKNGNMVPWTNSRVSVPSSHGGAPGNVIAAWNFMETLAANDYIEIKWQADSSTITMPYFAGNGIYPSTPSVILTINQVANWS